jgi:hypothetical protein
MSLIGSSFPFRNLDAAISNMAKNFAEGTDYFKVRNVVLVRMVQCIIFHICNLTGFFSF